MAAEIRRKTPEEYLRDCEAEERATSAESKGHLKIFLGYASGVGKSFRMLDEARRRRERGEDVVVGAMQPRVPPEVAPLLKKLEVIALKVVDGGSAIDVDQLIRRSPAVCIVDGLAYNNPPGSKHPTRWQDVKDLMDAGIQVVASINIQYISELRKDVEHSPQVMHQRLTLMSIKVQDHLSIGIADKDVPLGLERSTQFPVVVNFSVEGDDELAVGACHRLGAALRQVNNTQAAMAKANSLIGRIPLAEAIRTTCSHVIANAPELGAIDRIGRVVVGVDSSDAAHVRSSPRLQQRNGCSVNMGQTRQR